MTEAILKIDAEMNTESGAKANPKGSATEVELREYCRGLRSEYEVNRRVLLVQIPQFLLESFSPAIARKKGYYAFPPTGLQYLYQAVQGKSRQGRDIEVRILDLNLEVLKRAWQEDDFDCGRWTEILEQQLAEFDPFVVGISCMYDSGIGSLIRMLELLRKKGRSVVMAGGVIATYEWENLLERELCHFVVRGEGENKLNYLLDNLYGNDSESSPTGGIGFKVSGSEPRILAGEDRVEPVGDLICSYDEVPVEEYCRYGSLNPFSRMAGLDDKPFAAIQMNRGCRGNCSFCSVRDFMGPRVRFRDVETVLAEMEFLVEKRGVRHFEWLDDDLLFHKPEFKQLLRVIIERQWPISWSANNGLLAKSIDAELMELMRDSGCIGFKIGIETGNAEMLRQTRKPATLEMFRQACGIINGYPEIFVGGNFMVGFPGERFGQMLDSFRFFRELNLDWGAFTMCQAIRGATAFSEFDDYFATQIKSGENVKNFIPTRQSSRGELGVSGGVKKGLEIFAIDPQSVPGEDQVKEVWFTFNLLGNFIWNKNLQPGGQTMKFIGWVEMAQVAYPDNPYMNLFLGMAYQIEGDREQAQRCLERARQSVQTDYWRERFSEFGLHEVLNNFPENRDKVFGVMERLRENVDEFVTE
ncbi:MAG: B12-binding domain-containing radical SAM protein [Sedimentisphaerales bacterium]|nr:B12-binding domain-containing radical SAM protein [Sedimentisphaerales bacterium]